ncbi:MAG: 1-acyl-sn-glycerol-3-phosphate acyltransferase [Acidobacteria bacterium]|nr:1-acyl-sn-glycerol-3-phosphate acyltransferase [Acidobacteriota bacterium]
MKSKRAPIWYTPPLVMDGVRLFIRGVSRIAWRIKYRGTENIKNLPQGALLIVANHQTYMDPFWICSPLKRKFRFMAWDRAFGWPVIGQIIKFLGSFPVNTASGRTKDVLRESLGALRDGATLLIFPEGVREFADGQLLEFKTGAARIAVTANVPILPVTVRGANRVWPQGFGYPRFRKVEIVYHPLLLIEKPADGKITREFLESQTARIAALIGSELKS